MSYCRWSTDDFRCDLYIYNSDQGTEIHIASDRYGIPEDSIPPPVHIDDFHGRLERDRIISKLLERAETAPIGGPFDGKSFTFPEPSDAADWIDKTLVPLGIYRYPDDLTAALRDEVA